MCVFVGVHYITLATFTSVTAEVQTPPPTSDWLSSLASVFVSDAREAEPSPIRGLGGKYQCVEQ